MPPTRKETNIEVLERRIITVEKELERLDVWEKNILKTEAPGDQSKSLRISLIDSKRAAFSNEKVFLVARKKELECQE